MKIKNCQMVLILPNGEIRKDYGTYIAFDGTDGIEYVAAKYDPNYWGWECNLGVSRDIPKIV